MTWEDWMVIGSALKGHELRKCPHCKNVASWLIGWHPNECPTCLRYLDTGKKIGETDGHLVVANERTGGTI